MTTGRWHADTDEMAARHQLADYVETSLSKNEQETSISFFGDANRVEVNTYHPTITRQLLRHSYAEIEWLYVMGPDRQGRVKELPSPTRFGKGGHRIEGVNAKMPMGAVTLKGKPRNRDIPSNLVTTPADLEGLDDIFRGEERAE